MAIKEIKHKLGKITYQYDENKPWSQQDQQLADLLAKNLLCSESLSEEVDELASRRTTLSKWVLNRTEFWKEAKATLKIAQDIAGGYVGAIELGKYQIAETLCEAVNNANEKIQAQNQAFVDNQAFYEKVIADHNRIQDEHEEVRDQHHRELSEAVTAAFSNNSIATDMLSFDRACETLRAVKSVRIQSEDSKLNLTLDTLADFKVLHARVEGLQNVWEEFCSRMVLIEYIGKLNNDNKGISYN